MQLSLGEALVNGDRIFAAFIRDITMMKEYEELQREKQKSEALLNSILPKQIAEELKV